MDSGDFFLLFSAQKAHVKPPNDLSASNKRRSSWHVSSLQTAILDIQIKKAPASVGAFTVKSSKSFVDNILDATPLFAIF